MARLIERDSLFRDGGEPFVEPLYSVEIPGYVWSRLAEGRHDPVTLHFTASQLAALRTNVAEALLKADLSSHGW